MKKSSKSLFSMLVGLMLAYAQTASAYEIANERATYTAWQWNMGTTTQIPEQTIIDLCGDWDGCQLRMGMYNWDGTERTASRDALFYYDTSTRNWRTSYGDAAGSNMNNVTEHVMNAWSCYFTDGRYTAWVNNGDFENYFHLLSWNQYNATCKLTIID